MVGHQAIRMKSAVELVFALSEIIQVETVIISMDKYRLAVVPAMNYMMGVIRNYESTDTWHADFMSQHALMSNK